MQRGIGYAGPVYCSQAGMLCLHCIASGEAAERLGTVAGPAVFSDARHVPARVPAGVAGEVTMRTPGFSGLQQERWLYHCADAAAFPGRAPYPELVPYPDAVASLREDCQRSGGPPEQINKCLSSLDKHGEPTTYLFRCLRDAPLGLPAWLGWVGCISCTRVTDLAQAVGTGWASRSGSCQAYW